MNPSEFFEKSHQNFLKAVEAQGQTTFFYRLIHFTFSLQFTSAKVAEKLTPALEHLKIDFAAACDLTICVWDSASTGIAPIEFPWLKEHQEFRGEVHGYNTETIHTVVDIHTKALHLIDKEQKIALYWTHNFEKLPWWVGGSPFQLLFHWWMGSLGYQLTHAAAVGTSDAGVLLTGKSGSGKSTTTLRCMRSGMQYVGEDYCLLHDTAIVRAHCIYNSAKIDQQTLELFPELKRHVTNPNRGENDKAFLFHHQFQPEKIALSLPLKALLVMKIEESKRSWLESIEPKEALGSLAVTTLWQLTHTGPRVFKQLEKIANQLPCYILHLGNHPDEIPSLIGSLL